MFTNLEIPRLFKQRKGDEMVKKDFNEKWVVKKESQNWLESMALGANQAEGVEVTLPYDAMVMEERNANNPAGGACGFYPGGNYEYQKTFFVERGAEKDTFILEFEGIYNRGHVFVNGALAGSVHYGYTELFVDITPYLYFGTENCIVVKVTNADVPNSRWYTGTGIYRPVYLYQEGEIRIDANGLRISTPEIKKDMAVVKLEVILHYAKKERKTIWMQSEIRNAEGEIVTSEKSPVTLFANQSTTVSQRIYVRNPKLWSVDNPNLYSCKVSLWDGEILLDEITDTFGIRSLELNPVDGLLINGEKILLRGGCIHHDNGPVGAATFARAEERRIELLKKAGFNSVRISHNSSSKALLDACDRIGMLVMEESFDVWTQRKSIFDYSLTFEENWKKDFEDLVRKDFNHPCVFMYSIGNEIQDIGTLDGAKWSRKIAEYVRQLDSTRYVTNAINGLVSIMNELPTVLLELGMFTEEQMQGMMSGEGEGDINDIMTSLFGMVNDLSKHPNVEKRLKEAYDTLDVVGLNYMRGAYDKMQQDEPNRIFYGSETCGPDIDLNWKKVKEFSACIGDYCWTAWDYIGEAGVGIVTYEDRMTFSKPYPAYLAYCGDFDITGYRRPASYYREIVFGLRKTPYAAVQLPMHYGENACCTPWATPEAISSWTWPGYEGKHCIVEVYSDAPEVELFVNNKSIGKKASGEKKRYKAEFDTVYETGELKAVAYYMNGITEEFILKTAKDKVVLDAVADRILIEKNDLSYISLELKDTKGVLWTLKDRKVKLTIEGSGVIQGFGSADPLSEENFFDEERTTYYGRALAIIRAKDETGVIRVIAEAEGVEPVTVEIKVK